MKIKMQFLKIVQGCFCVTLLFASQIATGANWVFIQSGGGTTQYYDLDSLKRSGNLLSLKLMHDNEKSWSPTSRRFQGSREKRTSYVWHMMIDCSSRQFRFDYIEVFSEHMGNGILVESEAQNRGWQSMTDENKFVSTGAGIICRKTSG